MTHPLDAQPTRTEAPPPTPIPICRCGRPAIGMDFTNGTPVCSDHFIAWLESAR